jgi:hypothetical protein
MQIIERSEASRRGMKRYFTGRECVRGHLSERYVSTQGCLACLRGDPGTSSGLDVVLTFTVDRRDAPSLQALADYLIKYRQDNPDPEMTEDERGFWIMVGNYRRNHWPEAQIPRSYKSFTLPDGVPL